MFRYYVDPRWEVWLQHVCEDNNQKTDQTGWPLVFITSTGEVSIMKAIFLRLN